MFWCGYQLDLTKEPFGPNKRVKERQSYGDGKGGKLPSGSYSTVKSAQRLSATSSIRPRGRVQTIDM